MEIDEELKTCIIETICKWIPSINPNKITFKNVNSVFIIDLGIQSPQINSCITEELSDNLLSNNVYISAYIADIKNQVLGFKIKVFYEETPEREVKLKIRKIQSLLENKNFSDLFKEIETLNLFSYTYEDFIKVYKVLRELWDINRSLETAYCLRKVFEKKTSDDLEFFQRKIYNLMRDNVSHYIQQMESM